MPPTPQTTNDVSTKNAPGAKAGRISSGAEPSASAAKTLKDLLIQAKQTFGQARIISEPKGLHDDIQTSIEVKGPRDGQWRRVGSVTSNATTRTVWLNEDPKADPGDVRRVRALI